MKNANLLPEEIRTVVTERDTTHRRFFQVGVDILERDGNTIIARVTQTSNLGTVYTHKELHAFGMTIMNEVIAAGYGIRWRPVVWRSDSPAEIVTHEWVREALQRTGLKQTDLAAALGVDRHVISKLLSGKYALTNWHRAALYYFFKTL